MFRIDDPYNYKKVKAIIGNLRSNCEDLKTDFKLSEDAGLCINLTAINLNIRHYELYGTFIMDDTIRTFEDAPYFTFAGQNDTSYKERVNEVEDKYLIDFIKENMLYNYYFLGSELYKEIRKNPKFNKEFSFKADYAKEEIDKFLANKDKNVKTYNDRAIIMTDKQFQEFFDKEVIGRHKKYSILKILGYFLGTTAYLWIPAIVTGCGWFVSGIFDGENPLYKFIAGCVFGFYLGAFFTVIAIIPCFLIAFFGIPSLLKDLMFDDCIPYFDDIEKMVSPLSDKQAAGAFVAGSAIGTFVNRSKK